MFRLNLTELSGKVVFIEYQGVPYEVAEKLQKDLEDKGFHVLLGGSDV